jgi:hypothetical protein
VLPDEVLVTFAGKAFAEDGSLVDPATLKLAEALGTNFALSVARMRAHSA